MNPPGMKAPICVRRVWCVARLCGSICNWSLCTSSSERRNTTLGVFGLNAGNELYLSTWRISSSLLLIDLALLAFALPLVGLAFGCLPLALMGSTQTGVS